MIQQSKNLILSSLFIYVISVSAQVSAPYIPDIKDVLSPLPIQQDAFKKLDNKIGVIGIDSRYKPSKTTEFPFTSIGQLIMDASSESVGNCTATLIAPSYIITAAHCIYDHDIQSFVDDVKFIPANDGEYIPFGVYSVTQAYILSGYLKQDHKYSDIAILKLSIPLGNQLGYLGYGIISDLPRAIKSNIDRNIDNLQTHAQGNKDKFLESVTQYLEMLHKDYPNYALRYFGYSGDKNSELWGDQCIAWKLDEKSTDRLFTLSVLCDLQPGASGSSFIDSNNLIKAIGSYHRISEDLVNSSSNNIENPQGNFLDLINIAHGISPYLFNLIENWQKNIYENETIRHDFKQTDNWQQVTIKNDCNENMQLAMHYKDPRQGWNTKGFWDIAPKEKVAITTASLDYYYYSSIKGEGVSDKGKDLYKDLYGQSFGFQKVKIENSFNNNINLTCD